MTHPSRERVGRKNDHGENRVAPTWCRGTRGLGLDSFQVTTKHRRRLSSSKSSHQQALNRSHPHASPYHLASRQGVSPERAICDSHSLAGIWPPYSGVGAACYESREKSDRPTTTREGRPIGRAYPSYGAKVSQMKSTFSVVIAKGSSCPGKE